MGRRTPEKKDQWAEWLLNRREGGDRKAREMGATVLEQIRDRVFDGANITDGGILLDIGTGTGLIGLEALKRVGDTGKVIFSDISDDCLEHCRKAAGEMEGPGQSEFIQARAEDLSPIADASVDAVTTRSVIIYVEKKQEAFNEFFRVLKPGGHLSMYEPINRFTPDNPPHLFRGYDAAPVQEIAAKVTAVLKGASLSTSRTMTDFDERDLILFMERAGFTQIFLSYEAVVTPSNAISWEHFYHAPPNPNALSVAEGVAQALTATEAAAFIEHLRPLVESTTREIRKASAYVVGVK